MNKDNKFGRGIKKNQNSKSENELHHRRKTIKNVYKHE